MKPLVSLMIFLTLTACGRVQTVEVTRIVEEQIEVTHIIEQTVVVQKIVTATPKPTPRATATPKAPTIGTRQNPYGIGTTASLVQGNKLEFEFTIVEAFRGEEAYGIVKAANQFNEPAPAGYEFVVIHASINYNGSDQGVLKMSQYDMAALSGGQYIQYFDMLNLPCCIEPPFDFELFQGGKGEGWFGLTIPMGDPNPLLSMGGRDGLYFQLFQQ